MNRRDFLVRTGLLLGGALLAGGVARPRADAELTDSLKVESWESVREQFALSRELIHMAGFFLASHPAAVRQAIERHRRELDQNPIGYWIDQSERLEGAVLRAAAEYLGGHPADIALTDSTTMGLGLLYGGLTLRDGQEILTTTHDHYSTAMSLRLRAARTGTSIHQISLYRRPSAASRDETIDSLVRAIRPQTRIVAVTWVHSSTGVKLPIRDMADALAKINAARAESDRVLLCVDGVHGLGVEDVRMEDLGCDFFVAGTHKWMFGPRGTGLVWGHPRAWPAVNAIIPTFNHEAYGVWLKDIPPFSPTHPSRAETRLLPVDIPYGAIMTPGGFHSFEHRWALNEAFRFHQAIGKARVADRIHALNDQCKEGLAKMRHVTLHTPRSRSLSAGIICFEITGWTPEKVVERLRTRGIMASVTPYATQYVRLAPSLLTSPEEVETTLEEIRNLNG